MKDFRPLPRHLRDDRDLLLYFLWSCGSWSNQEIGALFGLTYSAVSRRVGLVHSSITQNRHLNQKLSTIKSLIKI